VHFSSSAEDNYEFCQLPTYLLTYLLTPWSRVLLEKLTGPQPVKKFPTFYGNLTDLHRDLNMEMVTAVI